MVSDSLTSGSRPAVRRRSYAPTKNLRRIGLAPFVAVLFAYCAGGPFALESMISTSGPGLGLTFLLVVPLLFSVPIALATAEMTTLMPVEGGFYRWSRAALGEFWGFQCGWWNWTGTFLMSRVLRRGHGGLSGVVGPRCIRGWSTGRGIRFPAGGGGPEYSRHSPGGETHADFAAHHGRAAGGFCGAGVSSGALQSISSVPADGHALAGSFRVGAGDCAVVVCGIRTTLDRD